MNITQYMNIGSLNQDLILNDGTDIRFCPGNTYWEVELKDDDRMNQVIKNRNIQEQKAIAQMNSILWEEY